MSFDVHILARTIYGEARGEGREGQVAVGNVIMNRMKDRRWPKTVAAVCLEPYQFSCWLARDPNRAKIIAVSDDDLAPFYSLATRIMAGLDEDPTHGSNHYHAANLKPPPSWADADKGTVRIGSHLFFKL